MSNGAPLSEQVPIISSGRRTLARRLKDLSSIAVFVGELISNPRTVGAPIPSSRALARRMASFVPSRPDGYVLELGPGTGVITEALLERGVPAERLILVERSYEMARMLRKKFSGVRVIFGDAMHLSRLLSKHVDLEQDCISHVVSSLPLRSLPKIVVDGITRELQIVLKNSARYIQYTYDLRNGDGLLKTFRKTDSKVVWLNLPPARVDVFHSHEL